MGYIILFSMGKKLCVVEFQFLILFVYDLLFATCYRVETESLLNHLLVGWQRRVPKLGIPRLTAATIRINVLSFPKNEEITSWTTM